MSHFTSCPTARQLLNGIKSLTRQNEGTFQTAWSKSFTSKTHCAEQGGFIYIDFPVPTNVTRAYVAFAPAGQTMNQRTVGPNASIDLNRPGIKQDNVILVANFHTHPLSSRVGGDPQPSRADKQNAYIRGMPGFVISRGGIFSYGPERRESLINAKGYPPESEPPPGILPDKREHVPPPPWTVSNQWPEGTGEGRDWFGAASEDVVDALRGHEEVVSDVIVLEWSDEDVEYRDPLDEAEDLVQSRKGEDVQAE